MRDFIWKGDGDHAKAKSIRIAHHRSALKGANGSPTSVVEGIRFAGAATGQDMRGPRPALHGSFR